jgi:hypothetical protein
LQIMKLVDKADIAIDKVRSLTHFLSKKTHDGPCTLKVKVRPLGFHQKCSCLFNKASLSVAVFETMESDLTCHGFNSHSGLY